MNAVNDIILFYVKFLCVYSGKNRGKFMALNLQVTNIFNSHSHMHSIDTPFASFNPFFLHSYLVFFMFFRFLFKNNIFWDVGWDAEWMWMVLDIVGLN